MSISQKAMDEIAPKGYVKPPIDLDRYFFRWNEVSFGIRPGEEMRFKAFLDGAISMLDVLLHHARQAQDVGERGTGMDEFQLARKFIPQTTLRSSINGPSYVIYATWDGTLFVDAEEDIYVDGDNGHSDHSLLNLNWNLGTLYPQTEQA